MKYKTTKEQCANNISGVCPRCGGSLEPIETVDNSGDPTFWSGCKECCRFSCGVQPHIYKIAKRLVLEDRFYIYGNHAPNDSKALRMEKEMSNIGRACDIVARVLVYDSEDG
jgi:hypothetical protein